MHIWGGVREIGCLGGDVPGGGPLPVHWFCLWDSHGKVNLPSAVQGSWESADLIVDAWAMTKRKVGRGWR